MARRTFRAGLAVLATILVGLGAQAPADAAASHALIQGSGSGWSANAINQWDADVKPNGLAVVYSNSGSAIGRKEFANRTTDFGVSDIGYLGVDPITGDPDTSQGRDFAYLPVVAGGTSFPYQIRVAGKLIRNLRLSGTTIAKIFTNQITNWNDPAITADNNGHKLPSITIIVVVHSEGSGATAQFTRYLDHMFPSLWRPYQGQSGATEYFPRKNPMIGQNGADQVMNFIAQKSANGAIGYDEYSYALNKDYPVAKVLNAAGYYTLPNQYNVAVALTKAQINQDKNSPDYLLQNLDNVYTFNAVQTYALSSYSYMIIPTSSTDPKMTTAKRQTLADYLYYATCEGQKEMGPIGYSPLPINLVQASFDQTAKLKVADPNVDLNARAVTTCKNPTFDPSNPARNYLAEIAPKPPACDHTGAGPCSDAGSTGQQNPTSHSGGGTKQPAAGGTKGPSAGPSATASGSASPSTGAVDPETGALLGDTGTGSGDAVALPTELAAYRSDSPTGALAVVAVLLLLLALAAPPLLARRFTRPPRDDA